MREICIFGVGDLPWLFDRPELFANKFFMDFEWLAYDCMEELLYSRTVKGHNNSFNSTYYDNLDIVKHKNLVVSATDAIKYAW